MKCNLPLRQVIQGDCLKVMRDWSDGSVDLLVTDPPYGISFMGKDWDTFNELVDPQGAYAKKKGFTKLPRNKPVAMLEFFVPVWKECLRILKPGSFMFVMCSARQDTQYKQVLALEQAGFNIGFTPIYWTYASGFPKAGNIGRMVDKKLGVTREVVGKKKIDLGIRSGSMHAGRKTNVVTIDETAATSFQAKELDGSYAGFQPKPAVEVILVAMKPLSEKTYVDQALKNGKGITWLEKCRIPFSQEDSPSSNRWGGNKPSMSTLHFKSSKPVLSQIENSKGRFPANLIVSDDQLNDGENWKAGGGFPKTGGQKSGINTYGVFKRLDQEPFAYGDSGSFSRYFDLDRWWIERVKGLPEAVRKTFPFLITPKASSSEKNKGLEGFEKEIGHNRFDKCGKCGGYLLQNPDRSSACKCKTPVREPNKVKGNIHPTVKPLKLMSYLVTLGSRDGDVVLDPFCGSGTTLLASEILNRRWIGVEIGKEYHTLAVKRLATLTIQTRLKGVKDN